VQVEADVLDAGAMPLIAFVVTTQIPDRLAAAGVSSF
jgi:hypothetical protein